MSLQQIFIACAALGLSASLASTYQNLKYSCSASLENEACDTIRRFLGAMWYSVAVGIIGIADVAVGAASIWIPKIPYLPVIMMDSITMGFYMGSGSVFLVCGRYWLDQSADCMALDSGCSYQRSERMWDGRSWMRPFLR